MNRIVISPFWGSARHKVESPNFCDLTRPLITRRASGVEIGQSKGFFI
jgi:hypothetical protein